MRSVQWVKQFTDLGCFGDQDDASLSHTQKKDGLGQTVGSRLTGMTPGQSRDELCGLSFKAVAHPFLLLCMSVFSSSKKHVVFQQSVFDQKHISDWFTMGKIQLFLTDLKKSKV